MSTQRESLRVIGASETGKSTALALLGKKLRPNLGEFSQTPPSRTAISEYLSKDLKLKEYFADLSIGEASIKPQYLHQVRKYFKGSVRSLVDGIAERTLRDLKIEFLHDDIQKIPSDKLQLCLISKVFSAECNVYLFDEPTLFLDFGQRIKVASLIRRLVNSKRYVIVADHDLTFIDHVSDKISVFYYKDGFGTCTRSLKYDIAGYVSGSFSKPQFKLRDAALFELPVHQHQSELVHDQSELGTVCAIFKTNESTNNIKFENLGIEVASASVKPWKLYDNGSSSVRFYLRIKIPAALEDPMFLSNVYEALGISEFQEKNVGDLSKHELQVTCVCICLGQDREIYLIDNMSLHIDCDTRHMVAKVIRRYIQDKVKVAYILEPDLSVVAHFADCLILYNDAFSGLPPRLPLSMGFPALFKAWNVTGYVTSGRGCKIWRINK